MGIKTLDDLDKIESEIGYIFSPFRLENILYSLARYRFLQIKLYQLERWLLNYHSDSFLKLKHLSKR